MCLWWAPVRLVGVLWAPHTCLLYAFGTRHKHMRAIDKLKAAVSMQPSKRSVELPDGSEFAWWMSPLTLAQRARAQKAANTDDSIAFALQLLVMVAKDENGQPLFVAGDLPELRNALPSALVDKILLKLLESEEVTNEEAEEEVTPLSSRTNSRKTSS